MKGTDEFYLEFGKFNAQFADVERDVLNMHRSLTGVTLDVARAVFSGLRAEAASQNINRMLSAQLGEKHQITIEFGAIFTRLKAITDVRNTMIHYGTTFDGKGPPVTTNRARTMGRGVRQFVVTIPVLQAMTADLEKISAHAYAFVLNKSRDEKDKELEQARAAGIDVAREPYRYFSPKGLGVALGRIDPLLKRAWLYTPQDQQPDEKGQPPARHK